MRNLVILRGAPGSGKSTWIEKNNLKSYTLCADDIRLMAEAPILVPHKTHRTISQNNDNYVWSLLFEFLEKRMQRGEFIIVDATHSRSTDFSRYKKLAGKYRYRTFYVDFSDVPIEVCKEQNMMRDSYKIVPDRVIDKIYSRLVTQGKTSGYVEVLKDEFNTKFRNTPYDFNSWDRIHIFGDIHGCFDPLAQYLENNRNDAPKNNVLNPKDFYIFTGDYVDRGLQNKEVLEFLISIKDEPNVLMLEGNHEKWIWYYANEEIENIKSRIFKNRTIPQIEGIDLSELRSLYRKIGQMAYFNYGDKTYIVTHGGLPYLPDDLQFVATEQLISGVGDYTIDIDNIYEENMKNTNIYQIHGHRNSFGVGIGDYSHSINLQQNVEMGGNLAVISLSKDDKGITKHIFTEIKNNNFSLEEDDIEYVPIYDNPNLDILTSLRKNPNIREQVLEDNISSFKFTRDAFEKRNWDAKTMKARGLFINTETQDIVVRGYNKFFNINEVKATEMPHLKIKLEHYGKATAFKKYNGYLGLLSSLNGELYFCQKSNNNGNFANWFKEIFYEQYTPVQIDMIKNYIIDNNVTMLYEVVDPVNDPHIIKNSKREIILLDVVKNQIDFVKLPYEGLKGLSDELGIKCKEIVKEFTTYRELMSYFLEHTNENNFEDVDIEGVVIEIGDIMTKMKFNYYNFWKCMRGVAGSVSARHTVRMSKLYNDIANYFYKFLITIPEEETKKDIISLRDMFEENEYGKNFRNK